MPVPSQGHYGFHSFPVVDWFCRFIYLCVLTFPLQDCPEFGNFVITIIDNCCLVCVNDYASISQASNSFSNIYYALQWLKVRENRRDNQKWSVQKHRQHWAPKTQDKDNDINVSENWRDNKKWTILKHMHHLVHKTQDEDKQINVRENQSGYQECTIQKQRQNLSTNTKHNN